MNEVFHKIKDAGLKQEIAYNELREPVMRISDLRRAAHEFGEALTEQDLRDMMEYADPQKNGCVRLQDFVAVMKKTVP